MSTLIRPWLRMVVAALVLGCGGDRPVEPPPTDFVGAKLLSGGSQTAAAGDTLAEPIRIGVHDSTGRPLPGIQLQLNSAPPVSIEVTDALGVATFRAVRAPTQPGSYNLVIIARNGTTPVNVMVPVSVVVGPPARIKESALAFIDTYATATVQGPSYSVVDAYDNPVPNALVTFRSEPGGSVDSASVRADAKGIVSPRRWTIGTAVADHRLIASAGSGADTLTARVHSGPPTSIRVTTGDQQQVAVNQDLPAVVNVLVLDASGTPVILAPVTWSNAPEGTTHCTSTTNLQGQARLFQFEPCAWPTGLGVGTHSLTISIGSVSTTLHATVVSRPASLSILSGPVPNSAFVSGANAEAEVTAQVRYADGAPATGLRLTIARLAQFDYKTAVFDSATTDAQGIARLHWSANAFVGIDTIAVALKAYPDVRQTIPVILSGQPRFYSISAGDAHTCASSYAVHAAPTPKPPVMCWGRNAERQLGDGTTTRRTVPAAANVSFSVDAYGPWALAAGGTHTCVEWEGLYISYVSSFYPYHMSCWGGDDLGQTGTAPAATTPPNDLGDALGSPTAGSTHTCAVRLELVTSQAGMHFITSPSPKQIECWGDNRFGQLGDGTTSSRSQPAPINVPITGPGIRVTAGDGFTCAVNSDNRAFCWGRNADGQLGDGTTIDRLSPVQVNGGIKFQSAIAAGAAHVCALDVNGFAYCWGRNDRGQLGDGTTTSRTSAAPVALGIAFVSLAAGGSHTCGLTANGAAWCWGANESGQLGIGNFLDVSAPVAVAGGILFGEAQSPLHGGIAAGKAHTCGLQRSTELAYCWGSNSEGQLGDGTTINRAVPTPIAAFGSDAPRAAAMNRRR